MAPEFKIREITFEDILPIWTRDLWPQRRSEIEAVSHIGFSGLYNPKVRPRDPRFFAIVTEGEIAAVNSIHRVFENGVRSRGLFVFPEYRRLGLGSLLLNHSIRSAQKMNGRYIWSAPREKALPVYKSCGYQTIETNKLESMEFGPNFFCCQILS